eukprot:CAMPEP_0194775664 /NCGR_PEP_ID=MMETSP0323_2-20130528/60998_1 /TAXON_ID=2866 ORGANISM="Crypthecodinium cohnii, Strain Seligo" /NCGR_SAMPLE_ID=MMETSP0323_2 /ASSEMBLY_ACC=CAM_ASM_000346 /LENGTH=132 /DNA_ID=CAMNT_0039711751 /DNA_START=156 /DNA_END=552 /DNA_ORIENTATION=+
MMNEEKDRDMDRQLRLNKTKAEAEPNSGWKSGGSNVSGHHHKGTEDQDELNEATVSSQSAMFIKPGYAELSSVDVREGQRSPNQSRSLPCLFGRWFVGLEPSSFQELLDGGDASGLWCSSAADVLAVHLAID